ncbi:putative Methyltransferase [Zostera marina]|uniref:EEF1A lysine methyltransferase 4 n=1 Tax=Zostera marina TaxID=29655 RepID=A0A0K9P8P4_ZOSMR|nr:putative Methyltransferase [Zostera marina]
MMSNEDEEEEKNTSVTPETASAYLDPNYWNKRFALEEHYEWLKDYSHFRHIIRNQIGVTDTVLEIGCGNSRLCEGLYGDGITQITSIDLSPAAVERMEMRLLGGGFEGIKVLGADMLNLPFDKESFDVVIEKGTMDVLFVDSGDPWNPKPETVDKVMSMLENVHEVLKPNGVFISISFGQPHFRRPLFEGRRSFTWSVETNTFGDGFHYFIYTLKKGKRSPNSEQCKSEKIETPSICYLQDELEGEDYIFRMAVEELQI